MIHFSGGFLGGVLDDSQDFGADDAGAHRDLDLIPHLHVVGGAGHFAVDADTLKEIRANVFEYFGVNEDVLQNKFDSDTWAAFYEGAIEPWAIQFSEVMTRMLFTFREQSQGNYVMATANRIAYMSNADKLNVSAQLLDRGLISLNEAREIWNLPPVDGGDARIIRGEYYNANDKVNVTESENEQ